MIIVLLGLALFGCAHSTGIDRSKVIRLYALQAGWQSQVIVTPTFDLQSFRNGYQASDGVLTIYLEGDGYAWVDGQFPSDDPTPHKPIAMQLAMAQPGQTAVAYLGRPCQYTDAQADVRCRKTVWTDARFGEAVIQSVDAAINQLKSQTGARQITLVGYSGGGAVALLVSARRDDVSRIITVAGNMDPQSWTIHMRLRPLYGSLDTATVIEQTAAIPQIYFVGEKDKVVPPLLTEAFVMRYPDAKKPKIIKISGNGHDCCWVDQWPSLWHRIWE